MKLEDLKHVVGEANIDKPAIIRFFGPVNQENTKRFNEEFLWLQECVHPSEIVVLINCEGGSVIYGMSTFSVIQNCPIKVKCINEGIAASMGSIIWAASNEKPYMHDYSILMIHNPFVKSDEEPTEDKGGMIGAFKHQLETIYKNKFGFNKEKVKAIMDGKEGADGTYFTAKDAVDAGIIPAENVIKTSKQACKRVKAAIEGIEKTSDIRTILTEIAAEVDENKLPDILTAIHNQKQVKQNERTMNEHNFETIVAQLGLGAEASVTDATLRLSDLMKAEAQLTDVTAKFDALTIKYNGKEAELTNVQSKLSEVEAQLQGYKDAEAAAKEASINAMVEAAITEGKIQAETKQTWINMAKANLDLTKSTLESIPARDKISEKIAGDKTNKDNIEATMTEVEAEVEKKVKEVVGEVKLNKF